MGTVSDQQGRPIPYVNIGVVEKNAGTVSDIKGQYSIELGAQFLADKLQFSSIGYQSKTESISELVKLAGQHDIVLLSSFVNLEKVIVTPKQLRTRILGNTTRSKFMSGGFSSNDLGAEAGTRIRIKKDPTYLDKVSFHLSYNKLDSVKVRLNIYAMKNGHPDQNILQENIIMHLSNKQTGKVDIDLSKFDMIIKDDILVALQLVEGKGDFQSSVFMSASVFGAPTYYREASHAVWKVYKGISIGINATVQQ